MADINLYIEDRTYQIMKYYVGAGPVGGGSARISNNDFHFSVNGTDDPFLFAWCATGSVKPAAKLVLSEDEGEYETSLEQVSCVSYTSGQNSQDPNNPSIISFALSAENAKTVVTY